MLALDDAQPCTFSDRLFDCPLGFAGDLHQLLDHRSGDGVLLFAWGAEDGRATPPPLGRRVEVAGGLGFAKDGHLS